MRINKNPAKNHHGQGTGRGPSSFWMHDATVVFEALALKSGDTFLDLGCGPGDYTLAAARIVGPSGRIIAMDKWPYQIDALRNTASSQGPDNINAMVGDITKTLPVGDRSVDLCLLSTVLHIFQLPVAKKTLWRRKSMWTRARRFFCCRMFPE